MGLAGLAGCASQDDIRADAGSRFPAWCANAERQLRDAQVPGSPAPRVTSLPKECRDVPSRIRIGGAPKPG